MNPPTGFLNAIYCVLGLVAFILKNYKNSSIPVQLESIFPDEKIEIIDFRKNNLHVVGYSIPLKKDLSKKELFKNLYFLQNYPKAIPYITSYDML